MSLSFSNGKYFKQVRKSNKARCKSCNDIIESTHVHELVRCKCSKIFTDGGLEYVRRGGDLPSIIDLSEYEMVELTPDEVETWRKYGCLE